LAPNYSFMNFVRGR